MNTLKVVILLASLSGLLMLVGYFVARGTGVVIALILSALMNFGSYWYSDSIVLRMYSAREVIREQAPGLHKTVESLAAKAGIPKPRVYMVPNETPNAFATGRDQDHAAVAVTSGIMKILNKEELEGVLAHELAHIQHRDILVSTMAATVASAVVLLSRWAVFFGNDEGKGMIPAIATAIIAPVAATVIQMAISRSREYDADAGSAQVTGKPEALASALRKLSSASKAKPMNANPSTAHMFIVNPLSADFIMNLFSTHPPIERRIERLMEMKAEQKE